MVAAIFEISFKVVLLGDNAVGKTTLLHRILGNEFRPEYIPTIKTSIAEKELKFSRCILWLSFWDTATKEIMEEESREYCSNAQAALIIYDVCRSTSLKVAEEQHKLLMEKADSKPIVWLIGNKIDLNEFRMVEQAAAKKKAEQMKANYIETSAKTGENVEVLSKSLLRDLIKSRLEEIRQKLKG